MTGGDCQQLSHPALQMLLNSLQMFFRQVNAFMALEPEPDHAAELLCLLWPHVLRAHLLIGDVVGVRTGFGVLVQVRIIFLAGIAKQGQPVVKNGGGRKDAAAVVIPQDAKVSKVAVLLLDQSVKNQHTADLLRKQRARLGIVSKAGGNAPGSDNAPDGDIGRIDVGKQGACRAGNAFTALQVRMHGVQEHG